jgi:hypothetical protein
VMGVVMPWFEGCLRTAATIWFSSPVSQRFAAGCSVDANGYSSQSDGVSSGSPVNVQ